jgi:hypothetical protein
MSAHSYSPDIRRNVTARRGYNRRRWLFEKDVLPADERMPFVCERASAECVEPVGMTTREYHWRKPRRHRDE